MNSIANEHPLVALAGVARSLIALMGGVLRMAWILIQGFRILTGRSRDSMMAMVVDMGRIAVIVAAATLMAVGSVDLQRFFGQGLAKEINQLVTGSDDSPDTNIANNLAYTQLAMGAIQAIPVPNDDVANSDAQSRASLIAMLGVAGPPMTAGAMLLMYKVAMALFILCLIFEQTKSFFSRWLMYGLATLFSMAVLNFMVSIVLELTLKVAGAMWSATVINALMGTGTEGFNNQALQQGGVGLLMTVLLVTAPAMAATFFGGTLGTLLTNPQVSGGFSPSGPGSQQAAEKPHVQRPSPVGQLDASRTASSVPNALPAQRPPTPQSDTIRATGPTGPT